ncbi:MAG: anion transporter [Gemmatimonadetes bacterium]|nr:anion transporter [Gemmatimonadota bacterium]
MPPATIWARVAIFAVAYALISFQRLPGLRLNRPAASLLGAAAMVTIGRLPLAEAYAAIDMDVIAFLLGIMLVAGYLEEARFFEWVAERIVERATSPVWLLAAVVATAGVLSALFVNDTICLVLTPLLLDVLRPLGVRPAPYLVALAAASNAGSVLTVTGNPQNMLVGIRAGFTFGAFLGAMAPVGVVALLLTFGVVWLVYRAELSRPLARAVSGPPVAVDWPLAARAVAVFGLALVGWLAGLSLPLVAITAGALVVAAAWRDPAPALARVEWPLLLFFAALFVLMRGLESTGLVEGVARDAASAIAAGGLPGAAALSGVMLVLSNLVSNVPAVLLVTPVVQAAGGARSAWLVVAMSATLAGNLILIGSMANLIVAERAATRGVRLGFGEYARVGIPLALLSILWGIVVLAD